MKEHYEMSYFCKEAGRKKVRRLNIELRSERNLDKNKFIINYNR